MNELLKAKNMKCAGKQDYVTESREVKLQTVVLVDLNTERWNRLAEETNTRSFVRMIGRQPSDYSEVRAWMKNLIKDTKKAPAATGAHLA